MTLNELKDLILFCKQQGIPYIEFKDLKVVFSGNSESKLPGENKKFEPAGLFDHIDGKEPDFTKLEE